MSGCCRRWGKTYATRHGPGSEAVHDVAWRCTHHASRSLLSGSDRDAGVFLLQCDVNPHVMLPGAPVDLHGRDEVLHGKTDRFEDCYVLAALAAAYRAQQDLAQLAAHVRLVDGAGTQGHHEVARLGQHRLARVDVDPGTRDDVRVQLAHIGAVGAHGVDVRARLDQAAIEDGLARRRGRGDDVGVAYRLVRRRNRLQACGHGRAKT